MHYGRRWKEWPNFLISSKIQGSMALIQRRCTMPHCHVCSKHKADNMLNIIRQR